MAEMRTLTMARILIGMGGGATLLLVATVVAGYRFLSQGEGLRVVHLSAAVVSVLLAILAHSWIVVFLLASARLLSQAATEPLVDPPLRPRQIVPLPLAASLAIASSFVLRSGTLLATVPDWLHFTAFAITISIQVAALGFELRAVAANERRLDAVEARLEASRG